MATRTRERRERRRVSARRRLAEHKVGGVSNYSKMPEKTEPFQPKAGRYRLDFMSWKVGKGNPFADEGEAHYERTFWVHQNIGPDNDWHLCAAKTMKQKCPICEYRAKLAKDPEADEDLIKNLAPKERQLWLVRDLEEPDQLKIWDVSFHLFGKMLDKKIQNADEEDEYEYFADPVSGMTVKVAMAQSDRGKWVEVSDIEMKSRREPYDADSVDENPCLDDLLTATPYDKLKALFLQTGDSEDEPEEKESKPKRSQKPKAKTKPKPKKEEKEEEPKDDDAPFGDDDDWDDWDRDEEEAEATAGSEEVKDDDDDDWD